MAAPFIAGMLGASAAYRGSLSMALRDKLFTAAISTVGTALKYGAKGAWKATKMAAHASPSLARFGMQAGAFAIRHPYATAGTIGAGMFLSSGVGSTPNVSPSLGARGEQMSMNINREAAAVEAMDTGVMPTGSLTPGSVVRNQRLMESTYGLVQGMHSSRH